MKKLTAEEILDIVKAKMTVNEFAYNEWPDLEDHEYSEEYNQMKAKKLEAQKKFTTHPSYNLYKEREQDPTFLQVRKEYNETPNYHALGVKERSTFLGLGEIEEVEQHGGEGEGDSWYSVKYFKDHDVYIRISGYYQSYDGTTFDQGYGEEVFPKQKMITVYESTKS